MGSAEEIRPMTDKDQDLKSKDTPPNAPQQPVELTDDEVEGVAGGIGTELAYTSTAVSPLKSVVSEVISSPSVLTLPGNVLAGK
jgi:hypothetical protein